MKQVMVIGFLILAGSLFVSRGLTAQSAPFTAIELIDGGHVTLKPGPAALVRLTKGTREYAYIGVERGVLIIDRCRVKCPHGYELEVEVTAPNIERVSVSNGGVFRTSGDFPRQGELEVLVDNGGMIDARAMMADTVRASVEQGGGIFTTPRIAMAASVMQGGSITYWGNPNVQRSVKHGGIVQKGQANQINAPMNEVGTSDVAAAVPAVPHRRH